MYSVVKYKDLEEKAGVLVISFKEYGLFAFSTENIKREFRVFCEWLQDDIEEDIDEKTKERKRNVYELIVRRAEEINNSFTYCLVEIALIIVNYTDNAAAALESVNFIMENEEYFLKGVVTNWTKELAAPREKNAKDILNEQRAAIHQKINELPDGNVALIKINNVEYVLKSKNLKERLTTYCLTLVNPVAKTTVLPKSLKELKLKNNMLKVDDIEISILTDSAVAVYKK